MNPPPQIGPLSPTALLYHVDEWEGDFLRPPTGFFDVHPLPRTRRYAGTCFAFRRSDCFLTAAHCVAERDWNGLLILSYQSLGVIYIREVVRHPTADLALLHTVPMTAVPVVPFADAAPVGGVGRDFMAFGWPDNTVAPDTPPGPRPRLFKGHVQQTMAWKSYDGYQYAALEMNIECPTGMSGAALFPADDTYRVIGLAAENVHSPAFLSSEVTVQEDGKTVIERTYATTNYGIAVQLEPLRAWLDEHVPPPTHGGRQSEKQQ